MQGAAAQAGSPEAPEAKLAVRILWAGPVKEQLLGPTRLRHWAWRGLPRVTEEMALHVC